MPGVYMVSLGCSKNRVDSEVMLYSLQDAGYRVVDDVREADVAVINTCGFIGPAKQEAIDTILEVAAHKRPDGLNKLIVTGCLAERYAHELLEQIPEIDALLGVSQYPRILEAIDAAGPEDSPVWIEPKALPLGDHRRTLSTPPYSAYLKVAEGCDNRCSYCAIPSIRGPLRSRSIESVVEEARRLADQGVRELTLIAQDTTCYGRDLYGAPRLAELIERILKLDGPQWIRALYLNPLRIDDALLDLMDGNDRVPAYLDIPMQHADADILKAMNREGTREAVSGLFERLSGRRSRFILRTSLIVGFPGEDEDAFERLLAFMREYPFDRVGAFPYSREEDTPAAAFGRQVPERVKRRRLDKLMALQQQISHRLGQSRVGSTERVLVEGLEPGGAMYAGRSYAEAPEVDGKIRFASDAPLYSGQFVDVKIVQAQEYDLIGERR